MRNEAEYPETRRTWLLERLHAGSAGRAEARAFLMELYAEPLRRTAQVTFRIHVEDAVDLVHGFFASRLDRPAYFDDWQQHGMRLRHWLWNGLALFRREDQKWRRRLPTVAELPDARDASAPDPVQELDRNFAVALVQAAMGKARVACLADGFAEHWRVFELRATGETLPTIAARLGLTTNQAQVRLRAPTLRFKAAVAELLVVDGVPREEVPRAIGELVALEEGLG